MKRQGGTLNASEKGKEVNLKRLHNLLENVSFYCGDVKRLTDDQRVVVGRRDRWSLGPLES